MENDAKTSVLRNTLCLFIPLLLLYATSYFQRTALPGTIVGDLQRDLGVNAEQVGFISAAFIYAYSIPQLAAGMLIDRFCGARVVVFGGLVFVCGVLWLPFCRTLPLIYAARAVTGLGASTMYLSLVKECDRLFGRKYYAILIGIAYFFGYSGGVCGKLPFALLCRAYPWRDVMLAAGGVSAACYLIFLAGKAQMTMPPPPRNRFSFAPLRHALTNRLTWLVVFCSSVNFCVYFTIQTVFGEKFLMDYAKLSQVQAAGVTFGMTILCVAMVLSAGFGIRAIGNRRKPLLVTATAMCFASSLLMTAGIWFRWPAWTFAAIYLGFAVSAGFPQVFAMEMQELNSRDGLTQTTALNNSIGYLAVAVFAPLVGRVMHLVGGEVVDGIVRYSRPAYFAVFVMVSGIALLSFLTAFFVPETRGHYLRLHAN